MTGRIIAIVLALMVIVASVYAIIIEINREARLSDLDVFVPMSYDNALEVAEAEQRILILDFMADWCGPCQYMDETTWRDHKVLRWVNDHGLAVQIDIDEYSGLAQNFGIKAVPTIVFLEGDGVELFRHEGYLSADEIVAALDAARDDANFEDSLQYDPQTSEPAEQPDRVEGNDG